MILVLTLLAGGLGALARFVVDAEVKSRLDLRLPGATIGINVSGSLALGALAGAVMFHAAPGDWETVLGTGFCGGYTTFSTAAFETVRLAQERRPLASLANLLLTLGLSIGACALGLWAAYLA